MGNSEQMSLLLKIRAEGQEAEARLKRIENGLGQIASHASKTGIVVGAMWSMIEKGAHVTARALHYSLEPLRVMARVTGVAGGAALALGVYCVKASADMETMKKRIDAVSDSSRDAEEMMKLVEKTARTFGFPAEDVLDAAMALKAFGQYSEKSLNAMAVAAKVAGGSIDDLISGIAAGGGKGMRRLGIEVKEDSTTGGFLIQYRTKMNEVVKLTAKTRDDVRDMLLQILQAKFSGGAGANNTFMGNLASIKEILGQAAEDMGENLRTRLTGALDGARKKLDDMLSSGKFKEIGETIGMALQGAADYVIAVWRTLEDAWKAGALTTVFLQAASGAAEILGRGFLEYLKGLGEIGWAMGKAIFAALAAEFATSGMPGSEYVRQKLAHQFADQITPEQAKAAGLPPDLFDKSKFLHPGLAMEKKIAEDPKTFLKLAGNYSANQFDKGMIDAARAVGKLGDSLVTIVDDVTNRRLENIKTTSGFDFKGTLEGYRNPSPFDSKVSEPTAPDQKWQYVLARRSRVSNTGETFNEDRAGYFPPGTYKEGQRFSSGAVVIHVDDLTINANSTAELRDEVLRGTWHKLPTPGF